MHTLPRPQHGSTRLLSLVSCSVLLAGCASAPKQTPFMEEAGRVAMTSAELRLRVHEFAIRFGGTMEQTALAMQAETDDPLIHENLIIWLLYGLPAYHKTLFQSDPYLALWDSWVLTAQLIQYYEEGPGVGAFGEFQGRVIAVHKGFYTEFAALEARAFGDDDLSEEESLVQGWVVERQLESPLFTRESVLLYPGSAEIIAQGGRGLGGALASVESGLADMNARMTVYTDFIPRQVQWQVGLAGSGLLSNLPDEANLVELLGISESLAQVDTLLAHNLAFAMTSIDRQRAATLTAITEERKALLEAIASERAAVLGGIAAERRAALSDIERILTSSLEGVRTTSDSTIGHASRDALLIVVAVLIAAIIYRFVSVRMIGAR